MAESNTRQYRVSQGDMLDHICFRYYGASAVGALEQVLKANPGLSAYGAKLPMGLVIDLPELEKEDASPIVLWG